MKRAHRKGCLPAATIWRKKPFSPQGGSEWVSTAPTTGTYGCYLLSQKGVLEEVNVCEGTEDITCQCSRARLRLDARSGIFLTPMMQDTVASVRPSPDSAVSL